MAITILTLHHSPSDEEQDFITNNIIEEPDQTKVSVYFRVDSSTNEEHLDNCIDYGADVIILREEDIGKYEYTIRLASLSGYQHLYINDSNELKEVTHSLVRVPLEGTSRKGVAIKIDLEDFQPPTSKPH